MTISRRWVVGTLAMSPVAAACGARALSSAPTSVPTATLPAAPTPEPAELVLLVASSLTDAFTEMAEDFPRRPEQPGMARVRLTFSFGASSTLRAQLEQGAPADLFASADTTQMDQAVKAGAIAGTPQIFVRNKLVLIVPAANRAGINRPADLAKPGIKLVTTPAEVPVGSYTRQMLQKMSAPAELGAAFERQVLANVVSEEANVRQVVTKVQLGEADAGIVYSSDVTPKVAPDVRMIELPDRFNVLAEYPVGVTARAKAPVTAQRFVDYLRGAGGQAILKKHNFIPLG